VLIWAGAPVGAIAEDLCGRFDRRGGSFRRRRGAQVNYNPGVSLERCRPPRPAPGPVATPARPLLTYPRHGLWVRLGAPITVPWTRVAYLATSSTLPPRGWLSFTTSLHQYCIPYPNPMTTHLQSSEITWLQWRILALSIFTKSSSNGTNDHSTMW
jgi:hypothetical protein